MILPAQLPHQSLRLQGQHLNGQLLLSTLQQHHQQQAQQQQAPQAQQAPQPHLLPTGAFSAPSQPPTPAGKGPLLHIAVQYLRRRL